MVLLNGNFHKNPSSIHISIQLHVLKGCLLPHVRSKHETLQHWLDNAMTRGAHCCGEWKARHGESNKSQSSFLIFTSQAHSRACSLVPTHASYNLYGSPHSWGFLCIAFLGYHGPRKTNLKKKPQRHQLLQLHCRFDTVGWAHCSKTKDNIVN
jgi:hypothetical protein